MLLPPQRYVPAATPAPAHPLAATCAPVPKPLSADCMARLDKEGRAVAHRSHDALLAEQEEIRAMTAETVAFAGSALGSATTAVEALYRGVSSKRNRDGMPTWCLPADTESKDVFEYLPGLTTRAILTRDAGTKQVAT